MSQIQIQILNATVSAHPTKVVGKTTPKLELAYKNLTFQGKVEGKSFFSFGDQATTFKVLETAKPGEVYDIATVKNGKGYIDWISAKKSDGTMIPSVPAAAPVARAGVVATKSSYPTDEERAKTQIYIVRQHNITAALTNLSIGAKKPLEVSEVLAMAKQFENYVFGNSTADIDVPKPAVPSFGDLEDKDDFPDMPQ